MESNGHLRFIRIDDMNLIPRGLIEQVRDYDFTPEELYKIWPLYNNPFNLLYALAVEGQVKGVLWLTVLPLQRTLFINLLSLAKDAQNKRFVQDQLHPFLDKLRQQLGLKNYKGITSRPKGFERLGFKRDPLTMVSVEG